MIKRCSGCKQEKDVSEFHKHKGHKFGVMDYCKSCRNPKVVSKRHNITVEEYLKLLEKQDYRCGICGTQKSKLGKYGLAIDHDHKTGTIRGLLCGNCNNGLGRFKDDIGLLHKAMQYLI